MHVKKAVVNLDYAHAQTLRDFLRMRNDWKLCTVPYGITKAVRMHSELGFCTCANVVRVFLRMRVRVIILLHISGGARVEGVVCAGLWQETWLLI